MENWNLGRKILMFIPNHFYGKQGNEINKLISVNLIININYKHIKIIYLNIYSENII